MHFTLICARYSATTFATCGLALSWCTIQLVARKCGLFCLIWPRRTFRTSHLLLCVQVWHADKPFHQYQKNEMTITFPAEETTFAFFEVGDGDFHTELCCLLSGSKWCSQVSSAVITFERNSGSSCTIIFNCMHANVLFGNQQSLNPSYTHTRLMLNFSVANVWVEPSEIFKFWESDLKVVLWSSLTMTAAVFVLKSSNWGTGSTFFWNSPLFKVGKLWNFKSFWSKITFSCYCINLIYLI